MASNSKAVSIDEASDPRKKRMRSPAFPFINLETALKRAKEFHDQEVRNAASLKVAVKHWNYNEKSSGGLQTAAALIAFGLLSDEGSGVKRKLKLTQNSIKILLDQRPESKERMALIKQAALNPKIHAEMWSKWGISLPSEDQLRYTLTAEWEPPFNENTVDSFIKEYKDTIAFAKLSESDTLASEDGDKADTESGELYVPKVGDYVQWEPQGILHFEVPKRVTEICSDGKHALIEGSYTGLPISELTLQKSPTALPQKPESHVPLPPNKLMQEFVVPLSEGNRAVFQWPVTLTKEDVADLKDSLKILERKITRSLTEEIDKETSV